MAISIRQPVFLRQRDCHAALAMTLGDNQMALALTCICFNPSLRGAPAHPELAEGRGNLDEVEHTSVNRRWYDNGIAALRSQ